MVQEFYLNMRLIDRGVLIAVVAAGLWISSGTAAAQVPTPPSEGDFILSSPSCSTFDGAGSATSTFGAGDQIVVRGAAFPAQSLVLVTFRQGSLTAELGRFRTNDAGEFTTEPTMVRLPMGTTGGSASIQASSGGPSGACEVQMRAPVPVAQVRPPDPEAEGDDPNVLFAIWATLLALGGGALTFLSYRTWQERRLATAISAAPANAPKGRKRRRRRIQGPPRLESAELPSRRRPPAAGWDPEREPAPVIRPPE
jgi:hypothetical protein